MDFPYNYVDLSLEHGLCGSFQVTESLLESGRSV